MDILLFIANFPPAIGSSSQIYYDLAKGFVRAGHTVDVITSYPRSYTLIDADKKRTFATDSVDDGISVHRVHHLSVRDNKILRGLEHFYLPMYFFREYLRIRKVRDKKFDICIIHVPPLPFYYLARMIKIYDGTPSILNFQDFHPQELTDVGFLKNPLLIKVLEFIERRAYNKADFITVPSPEGVEYVTRRGGCPEKIAVVYNPVSLAVVDSPEIHANFKIQEGIEDMFLVTYAGILSPFQGLDVILEVAKTLLEQKDIIFYIVGDGMTRCRLEQRVEDENISNVRIRPYVPRVEYLNIIKSTDVALITLDDRMLAPCLPGKTVNLMAMKKPIIAIVAEESETANIIRTAMCGLVTPSRNLNGICDALCQMKNDASLREGLGVCGRSYFINHMSQDVVLHQYEEIVLKLMNVEKNA